MQSYFIITPSINGEGIVYKNRHIISECNNTDIQAIKQALKEVEKLCGSTSKVIEGLVNNNTFVIRDVAIVQDAITMKSFIRRIDKYISRMSLAIETLGLPNIETLQIYYKGNDESEIPKWLEYAQSQGYKGIEILKDVPFGEVEATKVVVE